MSKLLVVVFNDEEKAYEGTRALKELHAEGSISAYSGAVVARDADGKVTTKDAADEGPIGTAVGLFIGGLVGIFAGPAGMVAGAAMGGMFGSIADIVNLGFGSDAVDEVGAKLEPGTFAVVAEIEENWVTPVDTRMEELGGTVFRRNRIDLEDEQIEREMNAINADLDAMEAEFKEANEKHKAKLQKKMDKTKQKLAESRDRAKARIDTLEKESAAKLAAIEAQVATANAETKAKLQKRSAEIKTDYDNRMTKLKQAWELTKSAVA